MHRFHKGCFGTLILRLVVGGVFLQHGIMKLMMHSDAMMSFVGGAAYDLGLTFFSVQTWFWIAAIVETVGGALIVLGLSVRRAAVFLAILMLFALNLKGWSWGAAELDYVLLGALVSLMFTGGKRYSLDAAMCAHREHQDTL